MTTRSPGPVLLVCLAVGVACGSFEPERPPIFTGFAVRPAVAELFTLAPGNTLQLTIGAYDQAGAPMPGAGTATYSSSAPAIATVNSSGVVTAVAPGTAVITAALTLGGITRTAFMTATVHPEIAGVYDLTALITSFDPAWGVDYAGYRYTGVVTLRKESTPPWVGGTYAGLQFIGPSGDSDGGTFTGWVTGIIDSRGRLVLELLSNRNRTGLSLIPDTLASGFIRGTFGCCGHIGGTFTAQRRPAE